MIGFSFSYYDVIVSELGKNSRLPRTDPRFYTTYDIARNVDGLYVAGRIREPKMFGKTFVIGATKMSRRRRAILGKG